MKFATEFLQDLSLNALVGFVEDCRVIDLSLAPKSERPRLVAAGGILPENHCFVKLSHGALGYSSCNANVADVDLVIADVAIECAGTVSKDTMGKDDTFADDVNDVVADFAKECAGAASVACVPEADCSVDVLVATGAVSDAAASSVISFGVASSASPPVYYPKSERPRLVAAGGILPENHCSVKLSHGALGYSSCNANVADVDLVIADVAIECAGSVSKDTMGKDDTFADDVNDVVADVAKECAGAVSVACVPEADCSTDVLVATGAVSVAAASSVISFGVASSASPPVYYQEQVSRGLGLGLGFG